MLHVDEFIRELRSWSEDVFDGAVDEVLNELDDVVPRGDDGPDRAPGAPHLWESREVHELTRTHYEVAYTAEHASYTNDGTPPHPIPARPYLSFVVDGQRVIIVNDPARYGQAFVGRDGALVVFREGVNHPGTKPTRWWSNTWTDRRWQEALDVAAARTRFG